jgi:hypothetical protein
MESGKTDLIVKTHTSGLATLPEEFEQLCQIVYQVNFLRQYPLSPVEIAEWARTLVEFDPELDYATLKFIIQQMKFGNLEYEQKDGVQNLTRAFQKIEKVNTGYRLRRLNVW